MHLHGSPTTEVSGFLSAGAPAISQTDIVKPSVGKGYRYLQAQYPLCLAAPKLQDQEAYPRFKSVIFSQGVMDQSLSYIVLRDNQ